MNELRENRVGLIVLGSMLLFVILLVGVGRLVPVDFVYSGDYACVPEVACLLR